MFPTADPKLEPTVNTEIFNSCLQVRVGMGLKAASAVRADGELGGWKSEAHGDLWSP